MIEEDLKGNPLFEQATLGIEAESFIRTKHGAYLWEKSFETERLAFEDFLECSPGDTEKIMEIQVKARAARMFRANLVEAIAAGKMAEKNIRDAEQLD